LKPIRLRCRSVHIYMDVWIETTGRIVTWWAWIEKKESVKKKRCLRDHILYGYVDWNYRGGMYYRMRLVTSHTGVGIETVESRAELARSCSVVVPTHSIRVRGLKWGWYARWDEGCLLSYFIWVRGLKRRVQCGSCMWLASHIPTGVGIETNVKHWEQSMNMSHPIRMWGLKPQFHFSLIVHHFPGSRIPHEYEDWNKTWSNMSKFSIAAHSYLAASISHPYVFIFDIVMMLLTKVSNVESHPIRVWGLK